MSGLMKMRTAVFARPAVKRSAVPWARLMFRYTDPKQREKLAQMQTRFQEVQGLYAAVPKEAEDIDWNHWSKTLKTPGVVDKLKATYDDALSKQTKLDLNEESARKAKQDSEIRAIEAKAEVSKDFLNELKSEISWTEKWYNNVDEVAQGTFNSWNEFKRENYYPTYKIHRVNRVMFGNNPSRYAARPVDKLKNVDLIELRKQLSEGNVRALGAVSQIISEVGDLMSLQRPFIKKWIKPINFDEVAKEPTKSLVYRAFALEQLLKSK
jgi:hypothetical protein